MPPTLLSIPDVAKALSCSRGYVYTLIEAGELPVVDIAAPGALQSKTRVRESDLEDYLTRSTVRTPPKG